MQVKESENDPNQDGRGCYSYARERGRPDFYVLTAAKGGPKLDPNQDGADLEARTGAGCKRGYRNFPMSLFANILSGDVDDTVVGGRRRLRFSPSTTPSTTSGKRPRIRLLGFGWGCRRRSRCRRRQRGSDGWAIHRSRFLSEIIARH